MGFGEHFLLDPELFPARVAGEMWGRKTAVADWPGGPYVLEGLSQAHLEVLEGRFHILEAPEVPSVDGEAVRVCIYRCAASEFRSIPLQGWETRFDVESHPTGLRIAGHRFVAKLQGLDSLGAPSRSRLALWTPVSGGSEFEGIVENVMRIGVAYRVLSLGGVMLHSAAVVSRPERLRRLLGDALQSRGCRGQDGTAARASSGVLDEPEAGASLFSSEGASRLVRLGRVFAGVSGAGKSTAARVSLERGHVVLSDDLNAILPTTRGGFEVSWLPFGGDFRGTRPPPEFLPSVPLGGLHWLEKAPKPYRIPCSPVEAVGRLASVAPFVNADPHRVPRLLENLERLVAAVGVERLGFAPDATFWDILEPSWTSGCDGS